MTRLNECGFIPHYPGVLKANIHFCARRSGLGGKGALCVQLGLTHVVDASAESCADVIQVARRAGVTPPMVFLIPPLCDNDGRESLPEQVVIAARACSSECGQVVPIGKLHLLDCDVLCRERESADF